MACLITYASVAGAYGTGLVIAVLDTGVRNRIMLFHVTSARSRSEC